QQESSRKLGFGAQRTMRLAQQLYEGVELNGESIGLITYMRTDSVNLANDAIQEIRAYVAAQYGDDNVPEKPQTYKNKSKNAQEAHEAVRPTSVVRAPSEIKGALNDDQFKLYNLIWKRAVASQMIHATMDTVAVDFAAGEGTIFRSTGSTIKHAGFMRVYLEGLDEKDEKDADKQDDKERHLPAFEKGDRVPVQEIRKDQHFTEPPPRYTEASLVKTLEAYGIGRPSTYASIISTLVNREYVELEQRRFQPTEVGKIVSKFLINHFTRYVDYDFTAKLEDELDAVSRGEKEWRPVIHDFWGEFIKLVEDKEVSVSREEAMQARELGADPKSGKPVSVRMGRYGPFVQIGTKDDEEKPKFAGLHPGQKMDEIDLEQALTLFKLPRELGETPEGEKVSANVGRFGPYIRYGDKYVSLKDADPYTVSLEHALELVVEKKQLDASRVIQVFEEQGIQILRGRYGPYVTNGEKNARVPKDVDPEKLTLAECEEMIANAPEKRGRGKRGSKKKTTEAAEAEKKVTKKKTAKKKKKTTKKKSKKKTAGKAAKKKATKRVAKKGSNESTAASSVSTEPTQN
ncbi:MAG: DNA topoisomerase, partial [Gammaproteobacteria bacterium]|nr:DNA topoisomerase [Gammaproteobacteria bacterium]